LARSGAILLAALVGCTSATATPSASPGASASNSPGQVDARLETVVEGLTAPIGLVSVPGMDGTNLVLNQTGLVQLLQNDALADEPFLDLRDRVIDLFPDYDERGLLGVAFHPAFAENRRLFAYYGAPVRAQSEGGGPHDHTNTLSEFQVASDGRSADPASERILLQFEQPQFNHSGGGLGFGPDGYLYLGTGDGGGTGDDDPGHSPLGNAQDLAKLNGKILRLDVDSGEPYAIPPGNPFADTSSGARPEIYAYGFRNPWRLSWEPDGAHRLLVSDVGYGRYEEIDAVEAGGNYGWRIREGDHCLDRDNPTTETTDCPDVGEDGESLLPPAIEYTHQDIGVAVVGGFVYRGSAIPGLQGSYVFADYSADRQTSSGLQIGGTLLVAEPQEAAAGWQWRPLVLEGGGLLDYVTGLGEDANGEIYVLVRRQTGPTGLTGRVLRLAPPN
jgi:glucose/arabinose dehydrogenase